MAGRDPNNFLKLLESPGRTADYHLFRVDGREMLSQPYEFRMTLRSNGDIPDAATWIGASVSFVMGLSDNVQRKVNGQCVRFEHAYQKGQYVEFVLDIAPTLSKLRLKRDNRIFVEKTAKQVIAEVLREHAIVFDDSKIRNPHPKREYCVQYMETDFDFISRLMEREGVFYYFRYDEGAGQFKHKMYLADDPSGYFDGEPFKLSFRRDHLLRGLEQVETSYAAATGGWIARDYDFKQPRTALNTRTPTSLPHGDKSASVRDWPAGVPTAAEVSRRSKLAMEEAEASAVTLEGVGAYVNFTPGARFEIDDPRLTPRERRIAVRSVVHAAWDPPGLEEGEPSYQQQFTATPSQRAYRPPAVTPPALVRGPQTGVVVDQRDPEGFGRIKVRFHWDDRGASTCWLRVAQQWAGDRIGAQWIPRVGMEVLVDFLEGDPDRPIVTGCIYNGDNKHPFPVPAELHKSGWRTETHPTGSVINAFVFDDKSGAEEIYTFAGRDFRRETKKDETVTVGGNRSVTVTGNYSMKATGSMSLKSTGTGEVHSTAPLTISSSTSITIKVGGSSISISPIGISISGPLVKIN